MHFDLNPIQLVIMAAVALIVIGPKDLPVVLRKLGQFTAKMRGLAAEFRASFDEMARQSELDELRKEVEALRTGQLGQGAAPDLQSHVDEINQHLSTPYWEPSSIYGSDPATEEAEGLSAEGLSLADASAATETSQAAPQDTAKRARKRAAKAAADPDAPVAARKPKRKRAAAQAADPSTDPSAVAKPARARRAKAAAQTAAKTAKDSAPA
jgi:sec-independent protein translocase protein TatB